MDSQKKTAASTTKSGGSATSSRRAAEKPSATTSVARTETQPTNPPTTTAAQIPTTSTATTASPMIPLSHLELILKQLQPNFDLSKTLATLAQPQEITPPTPIAQPTPATPVVGNEEAADEWFDAEAGGATPAAEQDEEEVHSGATEVLGEDDEKEMGDDAGSKPAHDEEQAERMGEQPEGVEMNPTGGRIEDIVIVPDDDEGERDEQSQGDLEQGVVGHEEGLPRNVVGATVRRRRLLIEEASEEEEEEVQFHPIGEPLSQRQPEVPKAELERLQRERKRKGKNIAAPAKKKLRPASTTVVIQEPRSERAVVQQEEDSDEEEALQWERRSKRRHEGAQGRERRRQEEADGYCAAE